MADYDALEDLDDQAMLVMAHRYLGTFPAVGLDEAQARTWNRSIWNFIVELPGPSTAAAPQPTEHNGRGRLLAAPPGRLASEPPGASS